MRGAPLASILLALTACAPSGSGEGDASTAATDTDTSTATGDAPETGTGATLDVICSVETTAEGAKTCFGWAFTNLSWTSSQITVVLKNAFYDTELNPEALPFESAQLDVARGDELLWSLDVPIVAGDPIQTDPCGPVCWHALAELTLD